MRLRQSPNIKLIIIDYYGVLTKGSYQDTCRWLSKKYGIPYNKVYDVVYHKYFSAAALGKMTEPQSFAGPIKELKFNETWQGLRKKHLSFQRINRPVLNLALKLQKQGYKILILSKNTPPQFKYGLNKMRARKYFRNIVNTYDLKLPKASKQTMLWVFKKFKVKPQEVIFVDDQDFNLPEAKKFGVKTIYYKNFRNFRTKLNKLLKQYG